MTAAADYTDTILLHPADFLSALAEHERQAAALALAARRLEGLGTWLDRRLELGGGRVVELEAPDERVVIGTGERH